MVVDIFFLLHGVVIVGHSWRNLLQRSSKSSGNTAVAPISRG